MGVFLPSTPFFSNYQSSSLVIFFEVSLPITTTTPPYFLTLFLNPSYLSGLRGWGGAASPRVLS